METATTNPSSNSTSISFTGLTEEPSAFAVITTTQITLSTTNTVTAVVCDGENTYGAYSYLSSSSSSQGGMGQQQQSSTTGYEYVSTGYTWSYDSGTLTISTGNAGYFTSSATYQLVSVYGEAVSDSEQTTASAYVVLKGATSDGACYVDTEVTPTYWQLTSAVNKVVSVASYEGALDNNGTLRRSHTIANGVTAEVNYELGAKVTAATGDRVTFAAYSGSFAMNLTGATAKLVTDMATPCTECTFWLHGRNANGNSSSIYAYTTVSEFIGWDESNTMIAHMIPVEKADGTVCYWDDVRQTYFYAQGTGSLTAQYYGE